MRAASLISAFTFSLAPLVVRPADAAPPATTAASAQAKQVLDDMDADGPDSNKHDPGFRIIGLLNQEFSSADPGDVQQAIADLHHYEMLLDAQTPRRGTTPAARARWYCNIADRLSTSMLADKQYDLLDELVTKSLASGPEDSAALD